VRRNTRLHELYGLIGEVMPSRTTKQWVDDLLQADILFGEVFSPEQLIADPHLNAVGMFTDVEHPTEGRIRLIGLPAQSSLAATRQTRHPPTLGQHSREIMLGAGLSAEEVDRLRQAVPSSRAVHPLEAKTPEATTTQARSGGATETCDAIIVGAGVAGLRMLCRLRQLDLSVRVIQAGDDVGGT